MSGHSKFANIKHKKEKNDAAKGRIFTQLGREIAVAVKEGGPDVNNNSRLKAVVAKAKANNMTNDTIERSIKKAAGDVGAVNYEKVVYEGYGPSGTAIIVVALTDNKNRTAANVRNAFTKGNGNVGTQGCVSYMFDEKGRIIIDKEEYEADPDELMMMALDAGAEDFADEVVPFLGDNLSGGCTVSRRDRVAGTDIGAGESGEIAILLGKWNDVRHIRLLLSAPTPAQPNCIRTCCVKVTTFLDL